MRFLSWLVAATGLLSAAEIPQGTHVLLRTVNAVSTRTAREGDHVYFRTASPIVVKGEFVVPVDSYVEGVVSRAVRSGRVKGRAELGIRIDSFTLPTGKAILMSPHLSSVDSVGTDQKVAPKENDIQQGGTKGRDAGRVAEMAGTGAAIGGLADQSWKGAGIGAGVGGAVGLATTLLTRGREIDLPQGTTVDVVFDRNIEVQ
jgi:hypothetical protein